MAKYAVSGYYTPGYAADESPSDFIWNYHRYSTRYPESGRRMELGNSYQYSAEPDAPDQRVFTLYFDTMVYFSTSAGAIDRTTAPSINFALLEDFYTVHRLWKSFTYIHPVYGLLTVKFAKPLETPKGLINGGGALEPFSIDLIEIP